MTSLLEQRLGQFRYRILVRSWDYRQRHHARGVWFRFRRVLADASEAYAVTREDAAELLAEGFKAEPVGQEIEPPKLVVFAPAARVVRLASARALTVRLSTELLAADCLVLVPFAHASSGMH
jgi:hypothetical protein